MPKVLRRERLAPNIHVLEVLAPEVARKAQPGQFVILMPDEHGERVPLTVADWDSERGSVTVVFLSVGTTTRKLSRLKADDEIPVFVGPLGKPSEIGLFGTVLLAGGCFGIASIYPLARALRAAGNKTIILVDVKAPYLLYWEDKLRAVADRFLVSTREASSPDQHYVSRELAEVLKAGAKVDRVVAIGCTYLMSACSESTRPLGIKTMVSLNPIMVDGTGMCGACRVTVGGQTKFACIDGPDFDGHLVDWAELYARRKSYLDDEIRSLCRWEEEVFP